MKCQRLVAIMVYITLIGLVSHNNVCGFPVY